MRSRFNVYCTFIIETILAICSPDSWHKKVMTVSSNMGSNSGNTAN